MENYDAVEFWNQVEKPIPNRELTNYEIEYNIKFIKDNIKDCEKILDFGPGKGRLFKAYKNKYLEAYDISSAFKNDVLLEASKLPLKGEFKFTIEKEIKELPYEDKSFDSVVAMLVLLHQKPKDIIFIMSELLRVGKKVIISTYWDPNKNYLEPNQEYISLARKHNYNYEQICKDNGWKFKFINHRPDFHNHLYFIMEN